MQCKWPIGDPRHPDFTFCTAKADPTGPYCLEHHRIAYEPAPAPAVVTTWIDHNLKVANGRRR